MHASLAHAFMQCVGSDLDDHGTYGLANCPLAMYRHEKGIDSRPSFRVSLGSKKSWGRCYACDWRGPLGDLLLEFQSRKSTAVDYKTGYDLLEKEWDGLTIEIELTDGPKDPTHVFPEALLDSYAPTWLCEPALEYLSGQAEYSRKIAVPVSVQQAFDMRWDSSRNRVCFPIRDRLGRFAGMHGRTVIGQDPPYLVYMNQKRSNPHVLVGEHWIDPDKPVVVAESVFDAARVYQLYRNVVTPKTASIDSGAMQTLAGYFHLITIFDGDKPGEKAVQNIFAARTKNRITSNVVLPKGEDADSLGVEKLAELLKPHLMLAGGLDPLVE